jgi:hypothetical protein
MDICWLPDKREIETASSIHQAVLIIAGGRQAAAFPQVENLAGIMGTNVHVWSV